MNHDGLSLGRSTRTPQLQDVPKTLTGFGQFLIKGFKRGEPVAVFVAVGKLWTLSTVPNKPGVH